MSNVQIFYLLLALGFAMYMLLLAGKKMRFKNAIARPFPDAWDAILSDRLTVYQKLPEALKLELQTLIKKFLYTKQFVGCDEFEITEEVRVMIAAGACLLILNRPSNGYKNLKWIYVYPSTFKSRKSQQQQDEYGIVSENNHSLLGVSWSNGRVVLAWDSAEHGLVHFDDGHNVVLHEFAHQLDQEDGSADGAPLLYTREDYKVWSRVFSKEFANLQARLAKGKPTVIDAYGATNPAEFFAVVTELYFERAVFLNRFHPELYSALNDYFRLDTLLWKN